MADKKIFDDQGAQDLQHLTGMWDGFKAHLVVSSACELELFDKLAAEPAPLSATAFAQKHDWDENATERLLNCCVSLKILEKSKNSDGKDVYRNLGPGTLLCKNAEDTIWGAMAKTMHLSKAMLKLPQQIKSHSNIEVDQPEHVSHPDHIKSKEGKGHEGHSHGDHSHEGHSHGGHSHEGHSHEGHSHGGHSHGGQGHGHHHHGGSEEDTVVFFKSMMSMTKPYAHWAVTAYDLSQYKTVVDLGGGHGLLSWELCRTYPDMKVILFDTPPVIKMTKQHCLPQDIDKLSVSFLGGDFTETAELPMSDLFLLAKIVHDWRDDQVKVLLKMVYNSTNQGGAIILMEKCLNDNKDGPSSAHLWDMLVLSHCAGGLRSGQEYKSLLEEVGYSNVRISKSMEQCTVDVIIADKL